MNCRPATPDETGYLVETFTRSFRIASTHAEGLPDERVGGLLKNLIANGWSATVCEADDMVIGWAVHGEKNRLAWIYVRDMARGQGVARWLLKHARIDVGKPLTTPFLPNRLKRRFIIEHRPFLCVA